LGNGLAAVLLLTAVVIPVLQQVVRSNSYHLSAEALQLVGSTDQKLAQQLSYDAGTNTYQFNKTAIKSDEANPLAAMQSQVGTASGQGGDKGLYALDVPAQFDKGVTYHDVNSSLSFSLKPQFAAADGRNVSGHLVFPVSGGSQAVYTLKNNGLKEDIVVPRATSDTMTFSYRLELPKTLEIRALPDGSGGIGIYSADPSLFGNISYGSDSDRASVEKARENGVKNTLVFGLPSPVIKTPDGRMAGSARFELHGDNLSVVATGLNTIRSAFTVDPSVVVTSTSDFQTNGNNDGMIDFSTSGQISRGGLTGGSVSGGWSTATTGGAFTTLRSGLATVAYNGYMYILGGYASTGSNQNDVQYAAINSSTGTIGAWSTTSSFANGRGGLDAVAYNGYMYILGGYDGSTNYNDVQYAAINSNGTLGTWAATASFTTGRRSPVAAVYNGYVYLAGGQNGTNYYNDVQYAPVNADGTLGSWATTSSFTTNRYSPGMAAYNGYLYVLGGYNSTNGLLSDVQYASINSDGTLGSWATTTSLTSTRDSFGVAVYNGYIYVMGGYTGSYATTVQYAAINATGTLGSWATTSSFTTGRYGLAGAAYNGYLYLMGGTNDTNYYNDTQYAKVDPAGQPQAWATDSTHTISAARALSCAVAYNGWLYDLGGSTADSNASNVATVQGTTISASGTLGTWTTTGMTALPAGRGSMGCAAANGYLYVIGGNVTTGSNDGAVLYSAISGTGTLGSWTNSLNNIAAVNASFTPSHNGVFINNGYIYSVGGDHSSGTGSDHNQGVFYAALSSNGSVGTWASTSSLSGNYSTRSYAMVNGYLYAMGGIVSGGASNTTSVEYAAINTNGTVGTWASTTSLPTAYADMQAATINGCIYLAGGETTSGSSMNNSYFTCPSSTGTIGAWQTAPNLVTATTDMGVAAYNGIVYGVGGWTTAATGNVEWTTINNGGSGAASSWTTSGNNFTTARHNSQTVAYNGYVYLLGGYNGSNLNSVQYARLNANGSIGTWAVTTNLATARSDFASAVYNGYIYVMGGETGASTHYTRTIEYAPINSNGTVGSWTSASNQFATGRNGAAGAAYNGYLYIIGGQNTSGTNLADVQYAPLNSNGTVGTWTTTTAFSSGRYEAAAVAYKGYVDPSSGTTNTVQYAPLNSNGTIGSWVITNSFVTARAYLGVVAYDGFLYMIGGGDFGTYYSDVQYTPIGPNGAVGAWTPTTSLSTGRMYVGAAVYNGNLYAIGGTNGSGDQLTSDYAPVNSIARVGHYSKLIDLNNIVGVQSITYNGSLPGGLGNVSLRTAGTNAVFGSSQGASSLTGIISCASSTRYVWVQIALDDSYGQGTAGTYADANGTLANLTDFTLNYSTIHPQPNVRLRNGMTIQGGTQSSLDTCAN
jgi:N-acetylneuraminic acid mutarotase